MDAYSQATPAAAAQRPHLRGLLDSRRVLLCVGCGGVGKTTTCAALGLAAARDGKRVLCLTIDPAVRLAQSLGLERLSTEAQRIDPAVWAAAGLAISGSLTFMMLDTKSTFDGLVRALAKDEAKQQTIFQNKLYQHIASTLAGTQEYMAMEKLYAVKDDPAFDLILLDTPPTSRALDFLDAPGKLADALDSPAVRWFIKAFQQSGKLSFDLLKRSARRVLQGMGSITGSGFLEQVASLVNEVNELFGGWRARADEVAAALRGPEVGYLLITTPEAMCIKEVLYFAQSLRAQQMLPSAYVVNRVHPLDAWDGPADEEIAAVLQARGLTLGPDRIAQAAKQDRRLGELNHLHLYKLDEAYEDEATEEPILVHVPQFATDIHSVQRLAWVAEVLAPAR